MHVGVFTYYYFPLINGVILTISDWKKRAEQAGIPMTVFTSQADWKKTEIPGVVEYPAVSFYKKFGITVPVFPEATIEKEVRGRDINILHAHHPFYIGELALKIKRKFHLPLVFTYHTRHSDYFRSYFPIISGRIMEDIINWSVVRFMNQCDAITVASESLREELLVKGVRKPIYIVPPGVDTHAFSKGNRLQTRKRLGLAASDAVLLYVGRLAGEKNIYFLMRSFMIIHKKLPNIKFVIAGNGPEESRLRTFVKKKQFMNSVIFATQETTETIPDIFAAADVFVYASQTETYGRVIVEAMASELPIVALAGPSIVDILQNEITGCIVFRHSTRLFAQTVLELVQNPQKMSFLKAQAKKEAQEKHDGSVSWSQLHRVYTVVQERYHG